MEELNRENVEEIKIRISEDHMSAYIMLAPLQHNVTFSVAQLREKLEAGGVIYGIKAEVLKEISEKNIFYVECLIATGDEPVFGESGYYDIPFSFDFDRKPKIKPDGTVDYNQFDDYCRVRSGDVIAVYKHATKGRNGMDVTGKTLYGKNGREQQSLRGKGFVRDEKNEDIYIATMDGRLEYVENKKIDISNLYEVKGNVNHATGDIQFPGDIHIYGNVEAGATVRAAGQIIVDGHVEAANLYAEQDIVLKNGMQGNGKGNLVSKGNVSAKFFEQAIVKATGTILAGAIMNCEIESYDSIIVTGKIGALIGGRIQAVEKIEANIIGNMSETKTFLKVGGGAALMAAITKNNEQTEEVNNTIRKISGDIEKIELILKKERRQFLEDKKMELIRMKFREVGKLEKLQHKRQELMCSVAKSEKARVKVNKSIYPGVTVNINDIVLINKSENYNVTYEKRVGNIVAVPNA